jgi:restriction endonuclease S subunit
VNATQPVNEFQISVPENWHPMKLVELGEIVTGRTPSTKKPEYYGRSYMFISPGDIGDEMYVKKNGEISIGRWD